MPRFAVSRTTQNKKKNQDNIKEEDDFYLTHCLICNQTRSFPHHDAYDDKLSLTLWHVTSCLSLQGAFTEHYPPLTSDLYSQQELYQCIYRDCKRQIFPEMDYEDFCIHMGVTHELTHGLLVAKQSSLPDLKHLIALLYPETGCLEHESSRVDDERMKIDDANKETIDKKEDDFYLTYCNLCHSSFTNNLILDRRHQLITARQHYTTCLIRLGAYQEWYQPKTTGAYGMERLYRCFHAQCDINSWGFLDYQMLCIHLGLFHDTTKALLMTQQSSHAADMVNVLSQLYPSAEKSEKTILHQNNGSRNVDVCEAAMDEDNDDNFELDEFNVNDDDFLCSCCSPPW